MIAVNVFMNPSLALSQRIYTTRPCHRGCRHSATQLRLGLLLQLLLALEYPRLLISLLLLPPLILRRVDVVHVRGVGPVRCRC